MAADKMREPVGGPSWPVERERYGSHLTTSAQFAEAFGYAWSVLRDLKAENFSPDETPAEYAERHMDDLRKFYPAATEGLES